MSVQYELNKIKQLEKEIEKCETNILKEFGINDNKAFLSRANINHNYDFKNDTKLSQDKIILLEKEDYKLFTFKNPKSGLWFINKNKIICKTTGKECSNCTYSCEHKSIN